MAKIPKRERSIDEIDKINYGLGVPRGYLGMSGIGASCWRKLWYSLHFINRTGCTARTQRIFDIGHLFEKIAIDDLKKIGCFVFRVDSDGNQCEMTGEVGEEQEELVGFAGHAKGHPDGRIIGLREMPRIECLLELKTMNDDKFQSFKKSGIQIANNTYYCQTQIYMRRMKLTMCFFLAINKNTCEYHQEFIEYDESFAAELERKEKVIIISDAPPERAYPSNHYLCNWCDFYGQCHANEKPDKNCRTCAHSDMEDDGKWSCSSAKHNDGVCEDEYELTVEEQVIGCEYWEKGWDL